MGSLHSPIKKRLQLELVDGAASEGLHWRVDGSVGSLHRKVHWFGFPFTILGFSADSRVDLSQQLSLFGVVVAVESSVVGATRGADAVLCEVAMSSILDILGAEEKGDVTPGSSMSSPALDQLRTCL